MPEDEKHTLLENIEIEAEEKALNENWRLMKWSESDCSCWQGIMWLEKP